MRLLLRAAAALLLAGVGPVHGTILPAVVSVTGYVVSGCAQAGVPCRGAQQTGVFLSDQYTTQSSFAYTTSLEQELLTTNIQCQRACSMDVTCRAFYFVGQCRHYYGLSGLVETALVAARCGTNLVVSECMPAIATLQFEKVPILAVPLYLMLQPDAALLQATTWVVNFSVTTHTVFAVPVLIVTTHGATGRAMVPYLAAGTLPRPSLDNTPQWMMMIGTICFFGGMIALWLDDLRLLWIAIRRDLRKTK